VDRFLRRKANAEARCGKTWVCRSDIRVIYVLGKRFAILVLFCAACGGNTPAPAPSPPVPPVPVGPPKPLDGATITITASGFRLDTVSAASFDLSNIRVYQGTRLTFVNNDTMTHDVLSDPTGLHNECPEINAAGYLVPGQSRATDPLNRLTSCGFHDHNREGNPAFAGRVTAEAR
jgi:hypothetical protein